MNIRVRGFHLVLIRCVVFSGGRFGAAFEHVRNPTVYFSKFLFFRRSRGMCRNEKKYNGNKHVLLIKNHRANRALVVKLPNIEAGKSLGKWSFQAWPLAPNETASRFVLSVTHGKEGIENLSHHETTSTKKETVAFLCDSAVVFFLVHFK